MELSQMLEADRVLLESFARKHEKRFESSISRYVTNRRELHLKHHVSLKDGTTTPIERYRNGKYILHFRDDLDQVYQVLNHFKPGFKSALCLWYSGASKMGYHRDHTAYKRGAVSLNIAGSACFNIKTPHLETATLKPGMVCSFDNKMPHAIQSLTPERIAIVLLDLKSEYILASKVKQLSLF